MKTTQSYTETYVDRNGNTRATRVSAVHSATYQWAVIGISASDHAYPYLYTRTQREALAFAQVKPGSMTVAMVVGKVRMVKR